MWTIRRRPGWHAPGVWTRREGRPNNPKKQPRTHTESRFLLYYVCCTVSTMALSFSTLDQETEQFTQIKDSRKSSRVGHDDGLWAQAPQVGIDSRPIPLCIQWQLGVIPHSEIRKKKIFSLFFFSSEEVRRRWGFLFGRPPTWAKTRFFILGSVRLLLLHQERKNKR